MISRFSGFNQPLFCCYYSIFFVILDARFPIVIRTHSLDVCIPVFFDILSLLFFRHSWIFIFLLIATSIQYLVIFPLVVTRVTIAMTILVSRLYDNSFESLVIFSCHNNISLVSISIDYQLLLLSVFTIRFSTRAGRID